MADTIVNDDAKKYELMVIINPDLGADDIKKRLDEIRKILVQKKGDQAGQVYFEDIWGQRDLIYSIKKHDRGYYAVFNFMTDPSIIGEIDNVLRLETEILRHMIVNLPFSFESKTLAKMEAEAAAAAPEDDKAKKGVPAGTPGMSAHKPRTSAPVVKTEAMTPAVAESAPKKVAKENAKEAPKKEEKHETTLEEVDAKLKSIIDNPDINF
jgi:small subunit ribosomal protein S6